MKTPEQMAEEYGASPHEKDAFLAGYQAAMNSPGKPDGWNSSNNSNGWISVKDRLPPDGAKVLLIVFGDINYGWIDRSPSDPTEYNLYFGNNYIDKGHHALTHWMPLPEPPKEEK